MTQRAEIHTVLLDVLRLKALDRAGWVRAGVDAPESVAAHSWGVAWLVLALCPETIDRERALSLAIVHDLPEVLVGDITPHDGVDAADKRRGEHAAMQQLSAPFEHGSWLESLWLEYADGATAEARFVKACDKLDMALQARRYQIDSPRLDLAEFIASARRAVSESGFDGVLDLLSIGRHTSPTD